jgi:hypothetical protein
MNFWSGKILSAWTAGNADILYGPYICVYGHWNNNMMATQDLYSTFLPVGIISDLFELQFLYEIFLYVNQLVTIVLQNFEGLSGILNYSNP